MISKLVDISILNPEYGVLSPIQLNGEKDDFDLIFSFYVKKYWNYKSFKTQDFSNSLSIFPVKFVMAAIWLLPIICIKKVGGFDPAFSHYGEDNDYVNRVYFHNYKVGVCPSALGYHDRKKRVKTNKQQLFFDRLACYIILKNINYNGFTSLIYFILICIRILMRYLLKLKLNAAIILLKEYVKILTKYPLILKERKLSRKEKAYLNVSDSKEDLENAKLIKELQDIEESEQVLSQEEFNKSLNL
jgi:GT2 family glycosyltransferase